MSKAKHYLFIMRHAAVAYQQCQESIDMMLALAAFEHKVSVLFMDEGIYQLLDNQQQQLILGKNHAKVLKAFPLYDIDDIYIPENSLNNLPITSKELILPAKALSDVAIRQLMEQQDVIIHG